MLFGTAYDFNLVSQKYRSMEIWESDYFLYGSG